MGVQNVPQSTSSSPGGSQPVSSGSALVGWLLLSFAVIPLAMAVHGDGRSYLTAGLAMAAAGFVLITVSRLRRSR